MAAAKGRALVLKPPKEPDPLESAHQEQIFRMAELNKSTYPDLEDLYAVPNGGWRHKATAVAMQRQGVKPGVPDMQLDVPHRGYHGLRIELKRFRSGEVSEAQAQRLARLTKRGYRAVVCWGWRAAWDELLWYLGAPASEQSGRTRLTSFSPYLERKAS